MGVQRPSSNTSAEAVEVIQKDKFCRECMLMTVKVVQSDESSGGPRVPISDSHRNWRLIQTGLWMEHRLAR